jgi:hypothetical protein
VLSGQLPAFYAFADRDWQTYNTRLVSQYKQGSLSELVQRARQSQAELLATLRSFPAVQYLQDHGVRYKGYRVTISRLIESEVKDEKVHLAQVKGLG